MTEKTGEVQRLLDELDRGMGRDPWHGDSLIAILRDVDARTAAARPPGGAHTIWEIVRHLTAWNGEVRRRLQGHPAGEPPEGDWPAPSGTGAEDWTRDVDALQASHQQLVETVSGLTEDQLVAPPPDQRNRPAGSGVTWYVMLHGMAQHYAYHGGQIAILKKIVR